MQRGRDPLELIAQRRIESAAGTFPRLGTSKLLGASAPLDARDTRNAVAVGLNDKGDIVELLLAGDADFYV